MLIREINNKEIASFIQWKSRPVKMWRGWQRGVFWVCATRPGADFFFPYTFLHNWAGRFFFVFLFFLKAVIFRGGFPALDGEPSPQDREPVHCCDLKKVTCPAVSHQRRRLRVHLVITWAWFFFNWFLCFIIFLLYIYKYIYFFIIVFYYISLPCKVKEIYCLSSISSPPSHYVLSHYAPL